MSYHIEVDNMLEEMVTVDGVSGVIAVDLEGRIIAARMPSIYDSETLIETARKIATNMLSVQAHGMKFDDCIYHFDNIRLNVQNLRRGFLVIMSMPTISVPLLNIATRTFRKRITGVLTFRKRPVKKVTPVAERPRSDARIDGFESDPVIPVSPADQRPSYHDRLPREDIDALTNELAKSLGPTAIVILQRVADSMGESIESFDSDRADELIDNLGYRIENTEGRTRFRDAAVRILMNRNGSPENIII